MDRDRNMTVQRAEAIAAQIQRHGRFMPCRVDGDRCYVKALPQNAFAFVHVCNTGRPDEARSWQGLEAAGCALHAGKDASGAGFYTAVATWDTFVHHIAYTGRLEELQPGAGYRNDGIQALWDQDAPSMP